MSSTLKLGNEGAPSLNIVFSSKYRCQNCWTLSLRLPSTRRPGRMKQSAGGKYPRRQILLFNLTLSLGRELSRDSAVLGRDGLFQFATVFMFILTRKIKSTLDFVVISIFFMSFGNHSACDKYGGTNWKLKKWSYNLGATKLKIFTSENILINI